MRLALLSVFLALPLAACVTSGDLQTLTNSLAELEAVAMDANTTSEELQAELAETKEEFAEVAEGVEESTEGFIKGIDEGAEGGLIGIGAALLLNLWRNHTRRKELEPIAEAAGSPIPPK